MIKRIAVLTVLFAFAHQSPVAAADTSRVIVKLEPGAVRSAAAGTGGQVVKQINEDTFVLEVPNGDTEQVANGLNARATIQWAEPDITYKAMLAANDPCFASSCASGQGPQWSLGKVGAPQAWDVTTGAPGVKVALIDSGVDAEHPDLVGRIEVGPNFSEVGNNLDEYGHGTHVAGILAANTNNGIGIAGVTWNTPAVSVKVLNAAGEGSASSVAQALYWSTDNNVKIANLSLGGNYSIAVADAVKYAQARGVLVIAAAANSGSNTPSYPAALDGVVAVGNSTQSDTRTSSSNYGPWVDLFAPGQSIVSTWPRSRRPANPYETLTGTSMSTPLVSGVASMVWGQRPYLTAAGVAARLKSTTDVMDGSGTFTETGRFNAARAVSGLSDGYRFAASDGGVFAYGSTYEGSTGNIRLAQPIVSMASNGTESGYWLVASDGGVFSFGGAEFYGSTGAQRLNKPIVTAMSSPSGNGYWLIASDGGVFSFGDAVFYGSTGAIALNKPIVAAVATATGKGYWLIASDGGVFSFGDAKFYGSSGNIALNKPIVGAARTDSGQGYWLTASDGGVFSYGDAIFHGSTGALRLQSPVVAMRASSPGRGYFLVAADGGVFAFGDARFQGSAGGQRLNRPIVAIS